MTLGLAERQGGLFNVAVQRCEQELPERSIYRLLHRERDRPLATSCSPTCISTTATGRSHRRSWRLGWCCSGWRAPATGRRSTGFAYDLRCALWGRRG
jgi:hypothetical protein